MLAQPLRGLFRSKRGFRLPPDAAPPSRYLLGRVIARGGMGVLHEAFDTVLGRDVAVKVPHATELARSARQFGHEARVTARLEHAGIIPVYDAGTLPDGRPFLAMRLVHGTTLQAGLLARRDPADGRDYWVRRITRVTAAVAFAHRSGVVHRDLKPANVLLGDDGGVYVIDWGLAQVLADPHDGLIDVWRPAGDRWPGAGPHEPYEGGTVSGTPGFMAPEQARGEPTDARTDVFSLGAMLCLVLTGAPAFAAPDPVEVVRKTRAGDLADAFARLATCGAPPVLVDIVRKCLQANPDGRYPDARAVAAALAG